MKLIKSNGRFLKSTAVFMLLLGVSLAGHGQGSYSAGHLAGNNLGTGIRNTLVGDYAGENVTGGSHNTFIGSSAGRNVKGSGHNTFVGAYAGFESNLDLEGGNSFLGAEAGRDFVGGKYNSFFGAYAGGSTNNVDESCFFGAWAGSKSGTAPGLEQKSLYDIYFGYRAGRDNRDGNNNIFIGYEAGFNNDGSRNIFIGYRAGAASSHTSDELFIANSDTDDPLIWGDFGSREVKVNGRLLISAADNLDLPSEVGGKDLPAYHLFVDGGVLARTDLLVNTTWADYVFEADYELQPLGEVAAFIAEKGHLPNVPSASEIEAGPLNLGAIKKVQQEKIEELFLHLIQMEEWLSDLERENEQLKESLHVAGR